MRVDHRRCDILMSKQGLNGAKIRAPLKQVGGETVSKGCRKTCLDRNTSAFIA